VFVRLMAFVAATLCAVANPLSGLIDRLAGERQSGCGVGARGERRVLAC
jgi:hypothetical protein